MFKYLPNLYSDIEGLLAFPDGLAIPNTTPFMIDTDNMAFFICSLIARFFCINGTQRYCPERMRGLCKIRLKISGMFLIKCLFLGLNFAKVPFAAFRFLIRFVKLYILIFEYLKNEYLHAN